MCSKPPYFEVRGLKWVNIHSILVLKSLISIGLKLNFTHFSYRKSDFTLCTYRVETHFHSDFYRHIHSQLNNLVINGCYTSRFRPPEIINPANWRWRCSQIYCVIHFITISYSYILISASLSQLEAKLYWDLYFI